MVVRAEHPRAAALAFAVLAAAGTAACGTVELEENGSAGAAGSGAGAGAGGAGGAGGTDPQDGGAGGSGGHAPCTGLGSWVATSISGSPSERLRFASGWTGSEMIVWGGIYFEDPTYYLRGDGARYDPLSDSWTAMNDTGAPSPRDDPTAIWTGTRLVVWGGSNDVDNKDGTGSIYDPIIDAWLSTAISGAPGYRRGHTAVWTGSEMIVWGGKFVSTALADGGRYDPATDIWSPVSSLGAPVARSRHTAIWTGSEMIIWAGQAGEYEQLDSGGIYDPATDTWKSMSSAGAPSPRFGHTAVWTGSEMIVWGGMGGPSGPFLGDGARYDPATDSWLPVTEDGAPKTRADHEAVWTGARMVVWGGFPPHGEGIDPATGGLYDPIADTWEATSTCGGPSWSWQHGGVWTGTEMIVWGGRWGSVSQGGPGVGGVYTPP